MTVTDEVSMRRRQRYLNRQARAQANIGRSRRKVGTENRKRAYRRWQQPLSVLTAYWPREDDAEAKEVRSDAPSPRGKKNRHA